MLSGVTRTPELALDAKEADTLALAIGTVNGFYNVAVAEKTLAWINLAMVAGGIYGSRIVAMRFRKSMERREQAPRATHSTTITEPAPGSVPAAPISTEEAYSGIPQDYMPGGFGFTGDPAL